MAKPKSSKKNTKVNETVIPSSMAVPAPEAQAVAAEQPVAAEAVSPALAAAEKPEIKAETKQAEVRKTIRKPEIVRTDSRATLVPINLEEEIRRLAYLYSERRGFTPGHETEDWLAAEYEVRQRYHQHSA